MSSRTRDNIESNNDRAPLLGGNSRSRDPNTPAWRHILENKITWAWYNVVIASGGVALLLNSLPYRIHGLWILGAIVYVFSLVMFVVTLVIHVVRFVVRPSLLPDSIMHPNEGLFISTLPTALGVLIANAAMYSSHMHTYNNRAMVAFYWIYVLLTLLFGIGSSLAQFTRGSSSRSSSRIFINTDRHSSVAETDGSQDITPSGLTSLLPLLLAGPVASLVAGQLSAKHHHHNHSATSILSTGILLQGLGIILTLMYQSSIITKLQTDGFRAPRASLFLTVMGPALTSLAATLMAENALVHHPAKAIVPPSEVVAGLVLHRMGVVIGLVFWALAAWWFVVAAVATLSRLSDARDEANNFMQLFNVVFAHVTLFFASNELLRVFGWPKVLTVLNEILGVATVAVWALVVLSLGFGVFSGRLLRD